MKTMNEYCQEQYGEKLYKLALSGPFTCPTRDGKLGFGGCIFCSSKGSGDFAEESIDDAKKRVSAKFKGDKYIAYYQSFTSTYAPADFLRSFHMPVIQRDDVAVLDIATRPDCLFDDVLAVIKELNDIKPVWVELGLQTSKPESIEYIRRRYDNDVYKEAIQKLNDIGVHTITHIILGLPGETKEDMLSTLRYAIDCGTKGIKLQLLHVLLGTDLADDYLNKKFETLTMDEYIDIVRECVNVMPKDMVVHRLTGDGAKKDLLAPLWSTDKKRVLNAINKAIEDIR